nr:MFS transporter [Gordonia polyisoprenivorans]
MACAAQFMVVLDISVVNVALPSIRDALDFNSVTLQWVVNAYALPFAGFLLLGGRLADLFGTRRVFLVGLGLFSGASLIGGLVTASPLLIGARALQGLGAAVLAPATLTILTSTFPEGQRRTRALATWTSVGIGGGTAGNVLGGVLTEFLSWRSTLLINVPAGAVVALLTLRYLPRTGSATVVQRIDAAGAALATIGLGSLAFGVSEAASHGWQAASTILPLATGLLLLVAFIIVESHVAVPLFPLRIFRNRSVSVGNLTILLAGACLNPMWYFLTLSMQITLGYTPIQTGLAFIPHTLVVIFVGVRVTPWLMRRVDGRVLISIGSLIAAAGFALQAQLTRDSGYTLGILLPAVVFSIGSGILTTPITSAVTSGVPPSEVGAASGLMNAAKQIGGALGLAMLVTIAGSGASDIATTLNPYNKAYYAIAGIMLVVAATAVALPAQKDDPAD